jgi:hypothetical protein
VLPTDVSACNGYPKDLKREFGSGGECTLATENKLMPLGFFEKGLRRDKFSSCPQQHRFGDEQRDDVVGFTAARAGNSLMANLLFDQQLGRRKIFRQAWTASNNRFDVPPQRVTGQVFSGLVAKSGLARSLPLNGVRFTLC